MDYHYYACLGDSCTVRSLVRIDLDVDGDGLLNTLDVDADGDGLIEIETAAELDDIRHVLDGSASKPTANAPANVMGCPAVAAGGCRGYELAADIDLASYGRNYDFGAGWQPVGNLSSPFTAIFAGNNFTIRNLYINRPAADGVGFFGALSACGS